MQSAATTTAIAELFRKDRATIQRACRDLTPTSIRGRVKEFQIAQVVDALIASAVSGIAGVGPDDANAKQFAKERTAKMKAQRLALERENAVHEGKYVAIEEAGLEIERLFSVVRENLLAVPYNVAPALVGQLREAKTPEIAQVLAAELVKEAIYSTLDALSTPDEVIEKAKAGGL